MKTKASVTTQLPPVPPYIALSLERERSLWVKDYKYECCLATDRAISSEFANQAKLARPSVLCMDEAATMLHAVKILESFAATHESPAFSEIAAVLAKIVVRLGIASQLSYSL